MNQATKASPAQVRLHIARQRALGERLINDHDAPRWFELFVTVIMVVAMLVAESRGWI